MKKIIFFVCFIIGAFSLYAQSEVSALPEDQVVVDLSKKVITPENQHIDPNDKTGKIQIEYMPMIDEVRIYYTCMYNLYEQWYAMTAIMGCLEDFTKENNYYSYKYITKDKERYYKDNRGIKWAQYIAQVKFSR